jgi:hypothetical protein
MRAKRMAIMTASHTQVRAILTPAQQQIFDALPPEPRGHRGPLRSVRSWRSKHAW